MDKKSKRIHRPRVQDQNQEADEQTIRQQFQQEKPSLEGLINRGDIDNVRTMGEYWELRKTVAVLKSLRQEQGVSINEMSQRTGMDQGAITRLEDGQMDDPTISFIMRYAKALGKNVVVQLVDIRTDSR